MPQDPNWPTAGRYRKYKNRRYFKKRQELPNFAVIGDSNLIGSGELPNWPLLLPGTWVSPDPFGSRPGRTIDNYFLDPFAGYGIHANNMSTLNMDMIWAIGTNDFRNTRSAKWMIEQYRAMQADYAAQCIAKGFTELPGQSGILSIHPRMPVPGTLNAKEPYLRAELKEQDKYAEWLRNTAIHEGFFVVDVEPFFHTDPILDRHTLNADWQKISGEGLHYIDGGQQAMADAVIHTWNTWEHIVNNA